MAWTVTTGNWKNNIYTKRSQLKALLSDPLGTYTSCRLKCTLMTDDCFSFSWYSEIFTFEEEVKWLIMEVGQWNQVHVKCTKQSARMWIVGREKKQGPYI